MIYLFKNWDSEHKWSGSLERCLGHSVVQSVIRQLLVFVQVLFRLMLQCCEYRILIETLKAVLVTGDSDEGPQCAVYIRLDQLHLTLSISVVSYPYGTLTLVVELVVPSGKSDI